MVSRNTSLYFGSYWRNQVENFCFDGEGNEIGLADLFVSDYNYRDIVLAGLKKALLERTDLSGIQAEDLMEGIQFSLNISDIGFTTTPLQGMDDSEAPVYFSITFEEFGCRHLTIFAPLS